VTEEQSVAGQGLRHKAPLAATRSARRAFADTPVARLPVVGWAYRKTVTLARGDDDSPDVFLIDEPRRRLDRRTRDELATCRDEVNLNLVGVANPQHITIIEGYQQSSRRRMVPSGPADMMSAAMNPRTRSLGGPS
jgi:hypothetical protein